MKRRAFLRGVSGATMALPSLEAMATTTTETATRMVCVGLNFGFVPRLFFPKSTGKDYQLTERLQPLKNLRDDFTVFSGLDHTCMDITGSSNTRKQEARADSQT